MDIGNRFAIHTTASCGIATTGEIQITSSDKKSISVFLNHTRRIIRFHSAAGGRMFYTADYALYFSPCSDALPTKLTKGPRSC